LLKFRYAWRGLSFLFLREKSFRIHVFCALAVVVAAILKPCTTTEIMLLTLCIFGVFACEAFNTTIERLCDIISPRYSKAIKLIKDISAGAVAVFCIGAAIVGVLIFVIPFLFQ